MSEVECVWPVGAVLGEGPVWSAAEQAVWFVDIKAPKIHRFHPASGAQRSWNAPDRIGFLLPTRDGGMIAGLKTGLHRFNPDTGNFTLLHVVEPHAPNNRLNDGFVDSEGFLWFGSMDDTEEEPSGALYQLGAEGCIRRDPGYVVSNGPAESPDGRTLYHTDTLAGIIYAFDRARNGQLSNKRVFVRIPPGGGYPDGPIVDAEGCLWTGLFGGWGLKRFSPAGQLLDEIRLPCSAVTKAAFAGDDLRTLYITTAHVALSPAEREQQPLAGGLFRAHIDVPGLPQGIISHGL
ncbi:MAG TPA: SMP-30/gluconolactonase/LRE family protein [Steroidobacteraceae bacterium]|nr:SMP-30/gluconolactonase/LRE family protein [Steroidobacteraceae bacterium]